MGDPLHGKVYGQLTPEQMHELGHVSEIERLWLHVRDHFWLNIRAQLNIPDSAPVHVEEDGTVIGD